MAWELGDYCSLNDLKIELHTNSTSYDDVLEYYIHEASADIDQFTNRKFYERIETRYYDALDDTDWRDLLVDDDLLGAIEITVNQGSITLDPSEYLLLPTNFSPKNCVRLRMTSVRTWETYFTDPNTAVAVNGTWGFNLGTIPPRQIQRACVKLAAYRYQKTNAPFEKAGTGDVGAYEVSTDIPEEIQKILQPYRRKIIHATGSNHR